jgi:hypothetical protein
MTVILDLLCRRVGCDSLSVMTVILDLLCRCDVTVILDVQAVILDLCKIDVQTRPQKIKSSFQEKIWLAHEKEAGACDGGWCQFKLHTDSLNS